MAKNWKLNKLRCMIKRWHSSNRIHRTASGGGGGSTRSPEDEWKAASFHGDEIPAGFQPVYVGKSHRRYLVSSEIVDHPLFRNLFERSAGGGAATVVGCEVVLFEHLLWMLENADPQPESLDELVDYYAC
ncbi:hypothetical protein AXF42_Ash011741 [Apostasia shenzhenica]|uniref:Uncharacterized protein n=1 Tax=Apostasia shenzhenica TaxID=1088818 RepID=A0A2H9ZUV3_9ASPA|nr:hypothetical protein AXF42_Ash011741 [Apostasia shenzhenica]